MAKVHESNKGYKAYKYGESPYNPKMEPIIKTPPATGGVPIIRRTLTVEERKERTAKGLCFNYDECFSLGHRCKGKLFRLSADFPSSLSF